MKIIPFKIFRRFLSKVPIPIHWKSKIALVFDLSLSTMRFISVCVCEQKNVKINQSKYTRKYTSIKVSCPNVIHGTSHSHELSSHQTTLRNNTNHTKNS